jgi:hypothetical protein
LAAAAASNPRPDPDERFHINDPAGYDAHIAGKNLMSTS